MCDDTCVCSEACGLINVDPTDASDASDVSDPSDPSDASDQSDSADASDSSDPSETIGCSEEQFECGDTTHSTDPFLQWIARLQRRVR